MAVGYSAKGLEKAPPAHAAVEQLEIDAKPLKFAQDREGLGNAARAVEEEAVGKAQGHALRVVADELQLWTRRRQVQIILTDGLGS